MGIINIKDIIESKNLAISFEPIVSVVNQSIIGFEVSSIGYDDGVNIIPMDRLIERAEKEDRAIDLDRLYREKAVEEFCETFSNNTDMLLFINISASIIQNFIGSGIIAELINKFKLNPQNVVLEIVEDKVEDVEGLKKFINFYRNEGYLVALSDIGYGFANLDKISYVEPDIIKISGAITKNIDLDYYKQEIFKSLVNLSKNIGALVIGDGISTKSEALTAIEIGADMVEGMYFGNSPCIDEKFICDVKIKVEHLASQYKSYMVDKITLEKSRYIRYEKIMNDMIKELSSMNEKKFDYKLKSIIDNYDVFECIYVLNEQGIQVTNTFTNCRDMISQKALIFHPAKQGTNHSLKKYYYFLMNMSLNKHITEPYISLATGNLCITISSIFENVDNNKYILCIDFNPNDIDL